MGLNTLQQQAFEMIFDNLNLLDNTTKTYNLE